MKLVDQDQVTHPQGGDHRARRDFERLKQKGTQQKYHQYHREQASGPVQPPRLHQQTLAGGGGVDIGFLDAQLGQFFAPRQRLVFEGLCLGQALGQKVKTLGKPIKARNHRGGEQQQGEITVIHAHVPSAGIADKGRQHKCGEDGHQSSTCKMAKNASCGTSTDPICFMRFLPAFCFSNNLRLRLMSPP